ncbi:MAG TPA: VWA domain-containing protein, partial [Vicinamibacteria bacterium]|nr:VWA domain-containing protein [Vicinamibacteria bacterium]
MRLRGLPVVVTVMAALAAAQENRTPTFSSQVELVTVDVVVLDGKGQLVRGLAREDFTILEDGKPQPIASFEAFDQGADEGVPRPRREAGPVATNVALQSAAARVFVILVDDMGLAPARTPEVQAALARFVSAGLRDDDELIFTTSSGDVWWSARMPEGREDVLALVARLRGRSLFDRGADYVSEWEAYRISNLEGIVGGENSAAQGPPTGVLPVAVTAPGSNLTQRVFDRFMARRVCDPQAVSLCYTQVRGRAREVDQRRRNRTRDVLAAVDRATAALTGLRGRKSLLLWTEGFLNDPDVTAVQEVASRCREANLAVYSLDVRGLIAGLDQMGAAEGGAPNTAELGIMQMEETEFKSAGSEGLAEDTGGFALKSTNDLAGGASRVAEESRVYYLLGYAPPEGKGPRDWRKLKVEVKRPGFQVRSRRGYSLRTNEEIRAAAPVKKRAPDKGKKKEAPGADTEAAPPLPLDMARALST